MAYIYRRYNSKPIKPPIQMYMDREKSKIKVEENLGKWWSYLLSSPLTLSQVIYRP
jgi:hypothetical protein